MKNHRKLNSNWFAKFSYVFLGIMTVVFLFPLYMAIIVSITADESIRQNGYQLIPDALSLAGYRILFTSYRKSLFRALVLTISTGLIQPLLSVFLIMCMAYPLSQPDFKGRNFWRKYLVVTMLFSGGTIPVYILKTQYLGLRNSIFAYLVPSVGAWSVFLFRTFFVNIDKSMVESAKIDGANKLQILLKIMLPLTKPLVVMNFFQGFVSNWNNIDTSLYYISDRKLYSIQYLLQEMLRGAEETKSLIEAGLLSATEEVYLPIDSIQFAVAVIGVVPVLVLFPYLQKFYSKGITVGSTKG